MTGPIFAQGAQQLADWNELHDAIFNADTQTPCISYPDAYFDESPGMRAAARKGCEACPVQLECLRYGIKWESHGMWGGLLASERQELLRIREKRNA